MDKDELIQYVVLERDKFCKRFMSIQRSASDRRMAEGFLRCFDEMIKVIVSEKNNGEDKKSTDN